VKAAVKRVLVASVVLASWLAIGARAQAATPPDAEGAASALVAEAARAYDQNQLEEALRLLARAYELSPRPSILYNQAQVLRAKNDCVAALDAYQRFIAATTPDDPNRERAVNRRAEMQTCADKRTGAAAETKPEAASPAVTTAPAEAPPPGSTATPGPVQLTIADPGPAAQPAPVVVASQGPTSPADDSGRGSRRTMRITGWTLVGVGVLAAGAAAVFAWQAHQAQEELNTTLAAPSPTVSLSPEQRSLDEEGRRDATLARWFGAAAALAGGGGAALLVISRPPAATGNVPGSAASHAATALVGWSGTF
jgi:tetratricopeptide (TPR) repeat protein